MPPEPEDLRSRLRFPIVLTLSKIGDGSAGVLHRYRPEPKVALQRGRPFAAQRVPLSFAGIRIRMDSMRKFEQD
jgi:hypothetical protein